MPKQLKKGDRIQIYEIISDEPHQGEFADSYFAVDDSGKKVFFKQYKNPTDFVPWFDDYFKYQDELKNILETVKPDGVVCKTINHFTDDGIYYQIIEMINGESLEDKLSEAGKTGDTFTNKQRYTSATVMMYLMKLLHDAGMVHSDLKPDNIYLEEETDTKIGWKAKLIDFDFSLIDGSAPPWKDDIGYVGTPGYFSPEHLKGEMPRKASDVFTCGIILYEMICGAHPYTEDYESQVMSYDCKKPKEYNDELSENISDVVYSCLDPDPGNRPDVGEIHKALLDYLSLGEMAKTISLTNGKEPFPFEIYKTTEIGRKQCKLFGENYKYTESRQFHLIKDESQRKWIIEGLEPVTNNTRLNGEIVTGKSKEINDGDVISVGKLSLQIKFNK